MTKSKRVGWADHLPRMEEGRNTCDILTVKPTRLLGRFLRRWEDSIRKNLRGISVNTRNWVDSIIYLDLEVGI